MPRFPINDNYGKIKRFESIIKSYPLEYKKLTTAEQKIGRETKPPNYEEELHKTQKNIKNKTCNYNKGNNRKQ